MRNTAGQSDMKEETLYVDTTRNVGVVLGKEGRGGDNGDHGSVS